MADIHPFHGIRYHPTLVKDPAAVICPPYDIISPRTQQELYRRSQYNFVRLEDSRELPRDNDTDNKYTRAAATLGKWLEKGILQTDGTPAIYLHDHHFSYQGRDYRRGAIICLVRLEEWDRMVVRPHEGTLAAPKSDRLSLLWTLQANISPILALFEDSGNQVSRVLAKQGLNQPVLDIRADNGEGHRLWAVNDTDAIQKICDGLASKPLYIADGHHRYESALTYRRERHACYPAEAGEAPYDFTMMNLVDFADPGLIILPAHRLVRGIARPVLEGLLDRLRAFFDVEQVPLNMADRWGQVNYLLGDRTGELRLVLCGLPGECLFLLRLRDTGAVSKMMPGFHSELYKRLDVSVIDHVILEGLLGVSEGTAGMSVAYNHDGPDTINRVLEQEYQLAFLVSPVAPGTVKAIADIGDRMPRKSTYFYPKAPAGLVFYRFGRD